MRRAREMLWPVKQFTSYRPIENLVRLYLYWQTAYEYLDFVRQFANTIRSSNPLPLLQYFHTQMCLIEKKLRIAV